jgi:hypothetical protein
MWAVGCILWELLASRRLDRPIWSEGPEMRAKRASMLENARRWSVELAGVVELLLV